MSLPQPEGPPGNRFALVTPDDNSAPVIVVTIITIIYSFLVFAVRIFVVKWKNLGRDDFVLSLAHIIAVIHWGGMFQALKFGLGRSFDTLDEGQLHLLSMAIYASRLFVTAALTLSKISVLLVIRSLFTWEKRQKILLIDISIVISVIWGAAAAITLAVGCSSRYVLGPTTQCPKNILRLEIVTILDVLIEFLIVSLPIILLWKLHMSRQKKRLVIFAFGSRLPLAIISILYLKSNIRFLSHDAAIPGPDLVPPMLWQEIFIAYSLMSATIPCLKAFITAFNHGGIGYLLNAAYGDDGYQDGSGSGRSGASFLMMKLKKKRSALEVNIDIGRTENTPQRMYSVENMPLEGESLRIERTRDTDESQRDIIGAAV